MADTVVQANNKAVAYRGRSKMPVVSKKQNAAMHAAAEGDSTLGIPQSVGEEFTKDQVPGSVKKLPNRVGDKSDDLHKRGLISDEQHKKMKKKMDANKDKADDDVEGDPEGGDGDKGDKFAEYKK